MEYGHTPVLSKEAIEFLDPKPGDVIVDATVGGGGHSELVLRAIGPKGRLIGIDKDEDRLASTGSRLARYKKQLALVKADYKNIRLTLQKLNIDRAQGVLFDLGVSSPQLDETGRGFSYRLDAPLDMRMDLQQEVTARTVVNSYSKQDLTRIIRQYGEERWASRIAEFILKQRQRKPIETTFDLVEVIKAAIPASARRKGPHPARRTFQAIRIEVNDELTSLKTGLIEAIDILSSKGRIVAISYHSLEDRIVKRTFKEQALPELGARLMILTKKPVRPSEEEVLENPRSESAKLRAAEKL
jgi:16S rRNA (cytosine1402-N4)-methyltransferase